MPAASLSDLRELPAAYLEVPPQVRDQTASKWPAVSPDNLLGLTVYGTRAVLARDLLPRSAPFRNENLDAVGAFALELTARALPALTASVLPARHALVLTLQRRVKSWWCTWSRRLHATGPRQSDPVRRIARNWDALWIAPFEEQVTGVGLGILRSRGSTVQRELKKQDSRGSRIELMGKDDWKAAALNTLATFWETLGRPGEESGLFFTDSKGMVRTGRTQVRDKLGEPTMEDTPKQSLDAETDGGAHLAEVLEDPESWGGGFEQAEVRVVLGALLREVERTARGRATPAAARNFVALMSRQTTIAEIAVKEGLSERSLQEAMAALKERLRRDPRVQSLL